MYTVQGLTYNFFKYVSAAGGAILISNNNKRMIGSASMYEMLHCK